MPGCSAPTDDAPAAQVAHWSVVAPPDHLPALRTFAERAAGVTVEFENVSAPALRWLARRGRSARAGGPSGSARTGSGRRASSPGTGSRSLPGGRSGPSPSWPPPWRRSALPLILKTAASGYDGKGQSPGRPAPGMPTLPGRVSARCRASPRDGSSSRRRSPWSSSEARTARRSRYPGRSQPARTPHPRLDRDAGGRRTDRHAGGPGLGTVDRPGARDRGGLDRRVLPDGRRAACSSTRSPPARTTRDI